MEICLAAATIPDYLHTLPQPFAYTSFAGSRTLVSHPVHTSYACGTRHIDYIRLFFQKRGYEFLYVVYCHIADDSIFRFTDILPIRKWCKSGGDRLLDFSLVGGNEYVHCWLRHKPGHTYRTCGGRNPANSRNDYLSALHCISHRFREASLPLRHQTVKTNMTWINLAWNLRL